MNGVCMQVINIEGVGEVAVLDEFREICGSAAGLAVCDTGARPSEVLRKLKEDYTVVLRGDYLHAQYLLFYVQKFEDGLGKASELKRKRLYRLNYVARGDTFPMFANVPPEADNFQEWLPELIAGRDYLIPARRYNRILTDISRARDGIILDGIDSRLYIRPTVYVPFDKSVPAMFMQFAGLIEGRRVLDMGTGTGVLAILAAQVGAEAVTACDININAVECAEHNISVAGFDNISAVHSDLFDNISGLYDVIIFNAPWVMGAAKNLYELAIYDENYALVNKFIEKAPSCLDKGGVILLQYSDISQKNGNGSLDNLYGALAKNGLHIADKTSILRRNRLYGMMERVYIFALRVRT